jgi:seryl-tRNA synthetase
MAASKEKLAQNVKNWLQIDKEIQILQKELKDRKKKKNDYSNALLATMKANEIDCFDISEGKIIYTQSNVKKPINKKHLEECLTKYFEQNPSIPTDDVVHYILENRPINVKESIRHKPIKNV